MKSPEVCVLFTDGINCDMEMSYAFKAAGANPEKVHINQLRSGERKLSDYSILAISGGFSYGDYIASGKALGNELTSYLAEPLQDFVDQEKPIIGVCNGFQVLVRTGLLPAGEISPQKATLAENEIGRFDCRWINLAVGQTACRFISEGDYEEQPLRMQTAHGEGRFFARDEDVRELAENGQVVFRYTSGDLTDPKGYPENPNGSMGNIAGVCNPKGTILGMMPHPERSFRAFHPYRPYTPAARNAAAILFKSIVGYAREV